MISQTEVKAKWVALNNTVTYTKSTLTRKLKKEIVLAQEPIPNSSATGTEANIQAVTFSSNYQLFLANAPAWLQNFEAASDEALCFLSGIVAEDPADKEKLKKYIDWVMEEENTYRTTYSENNGKILEIYFSNGVAATHVTPSTTQGQGQSEGKYKARPDLVPDPLSKQWTPLEFVAWRDKFEFWITATWGSVQPDSKSLANELKVKLDADWSAILKSNLDNYHEVTYQGMIDNILAELKVQHPILTGRTQLLTMYCEKGEILRDYISRVESQASVCQVEGGSTNEEVLFLAILRGTSKDVRTKVLQFFVEKPPTVTALKLYTDNIRSSEVKLSGGVNQVAKSKKLSRPNKSSEKCERC